MHIDTSAPTPSHDPAPHDYSTHSFHQQHQQIDQQQDRYHDHQHRHHHQHNHHSQPDTLREHPVEVLGPLLPWQQSQSRVNRDSQARGGFGTWPLKTFAALLVLATLAFFFNTWNQSEDVYRSQRPGCLSTADTVTAAASSNNFTSTIEDRVDAILTSTPLIDGHDDLAIFIREYYNNSITTHDFQSRFMNGSMPLDVDLARLRSGQNGGAFWSAFVLCPTNASLDQSNNHYADAVASTLEQIDLIRRLQAQYPRDFTPAISTPLDPSGREHMILQWHATRSLFGAISIEGLHQIPPTSPFSTLRLYHALGVRMATLTWNCHNPFADASVLWNGSQILQVVNGVSRPKEGAVTTRGKAVLTEMNRLGMIIDLSHTSYWTQKAVLSTDKDGHRLTRAPVVFSHSSAYTLCPHPRNVKDEILDLVPDSNSLVMVNFSPGFISCVSPNDTDTDASLPISSHINGPHFSIPDSYEQNNTLHQVARHIVYIGERIGYDYVGLGSDFDGMGTKHPVGLSGVDKFPDLVAELLGMGVDDDDVKKVVGGNLLRVWKEVDEVVVRMGKEGVEPGVDDVKGADWKGL